MRYSFHFFFLFIVVLFELLNGTNAEGLFKFRLATSVDDVRLCQALRRQVFVREQRVPADTELDGKDDGALHVMCFASNDGSLVATGRCLLVAGAPSASEEGEKGSSSSATASTAQQQQQRRRRRFHAVLGRIAVHANYRGQGIGPQVIRKLEQEAARRNAIRVTLTPHSYLHDFYARLGYRRVPGTGPIPVNEHCTLIQMEKWLNLEEK